MLRLLNLLPWIDPITPLILCGPFYTAVAYFTEKGHAPEELTSFLGQKSPISAVLAWRCALLGHLTAQAGVLGEYFPSEQRRTVLSRLYASLDSHFPLMDVIDGANTGLEPSMQEIYARNLAPEQCGSAVLDSSCVRFIPLLLPHILTSTIPIPVLAYELAACPVNDPGMDSLVSLFRQILVKREKMRSFLGTLFNTLCGDGLTNWLRETVVTIIKIALLGNYPDATAFVETRHRRAIYHLNHETILQYIASCAGDRSLARETELAAALSLLSTALVSTFSPNSIDYTNLDHLVSGWPIFFRTNQRIMKLLVDFYPLPPPSNLMLDIFRFLHPLHRKYENIFFLIANTYPVSLEYASFSPFTSILGCLNGSQNKTTTLNILIAILTKIDPAILTRIQHNFDTTGTLSRHDLSDFEFTRLALLARFMVDRWAFAIIPGSQALFFEQSARMLAITSRLAREKSTILYCNTCNTVRFRPVGVHLPASHITLLADLNFTRVYCVDCDGSDIVPINLMGTYVRCYLSTKKTRTLVTLTLCSACMHVCVVGFYSTGAGVICSECSATVSALNLLPLSKHCLSCHGLAQRPEADHYWTFFDDNHVLKTQIWCARCIPAAFKLLRTQIRKDSHLTLPVLDLKTMRKLSNTPYSVPVKYRHY